MYFQGPLILRTFFFEDFQENFENFDATSKFFEFFSSLFLSAFFASNLELITIETASQKMESKETLWKKN